jgi:hypothetical protein
MIKNKYKIKINLILNDKIKKNNFFLIKNLILKYLK